MIKLTRSLIYPFCFFVCFFFFHFYFNGNWSCDFTPEWDHCISLVPEKAYAVVISMMIISLYSVFSIILCIKIIKYAFKSYNYIKNFNNIKPLNYFKRRGHRDHMVVGFTTTYAISDLRQVCGFLGYYSFLHQ